MLSVFGIGRSTNFIRDQFTSGEFRRSDFDCKRLQRIHNIHKKVWEFTKKNARVHEYISLINNYSASIHRDWMTLNQIDCFQYLHKKWFEHLLQRIFQGQFNWHLKRRVYAIHFVLFRSLIIVSVNGVNNANEQVNNAQLLRDSDSIRLL